MQMLLTDHNKSCMKIYMNIHQYSERCFDTFLYFLVVNKQWNDRVKIRLDIDEINFWHENSCTHACSCMMFKNDSFHNLLRYRGL